MWQSCSQLLRPWDFVGDRKAGEGSPEGEHTDSHVRREAHQSACKKRGAVCLHRRGEWGTRAEPGKGGLSPGDIQIGSYAEPVDESDNQAGRSRGSVSRPDSFRIVIPVGQTRG